MRWSPFLALLLILPAFAQEGIPYLDVPAEEREPGAFVETPAGVMPEWEESFLEIPAGVVKDPEAFFEVAPDRFSAGSGEDRIGFPEVDHDDLDLDDQDSELTLEREEGFLAIPAGLLEEPQPFREVNPDRFSGGSRDGRTVYREMDHDDLDSERMVEVSPAKDPDRSLDAPTVVPVDKKGSSAAVVVPAGRISRPEATEEDSIFRRLDEVPPAPGVSPDVPDQERIYIPDGRPAAK